MTKEEQMDALHGELSKVLNRWRENFDLKAIDVVWVLECLVHDASDVNLDFEADFSGDDDE